MVKSVVEIGSDPSIMEVVVIGESEGLAALQSGYDEDSAKESPPDLAPSKNSPLLVSSSSEDEPSSLIKHSVGRVRWSPLILVRK